MATQPAPGEFSQSIAINRYIRSMLMAPLKVYNSSEHRASESPLLSLACDIQNDYCLYVAA